MKLLHPPLISRICNVLLIGGIVLFLSCQSDPIVLNPPGGYEYIRQTFQLDIENSYSIQGNTHTGYSSRLYSGFLSNGDTASVLIKLLPGVLDSHQVCTADSIIDVKLELISTFPLTAVESSPYNTTFIDTLLLDAYLINLDDIQNISEDDILHSSQVAALIVDASDSIEIDLLSNGIELKLFDYDNDIITSWCNNQDELGIVISYDSSYVEFYSSDGANTALGPQLFLEYDAEEEVTINNNLYSINSTIWSSDYVDLNSGPYFVGDSSSFYWGTVYALNLNDVENVPLNYDSISVQSDIIPEAITFSTPLLQINVELNPEIINENGIDSITFSLTNAVAFRSAVDPAGDNQTDANPDSTENNGIYDLGELFIDHGIDNCPDSLETGDDDDPCGTTISIFELDGTEGNGIFDQGETWNDNGVDGCTDEIESGDGSCDGNNGGISDPNEDNYNIDPAGDDWPNGREGNGIWNEGEPYQDWGTDGLPASMMGGVMDADSTEGNGKHDPGELFYDTGEDGLFNEQENGYNLVGTEDNGKFDGDGELNDCGEDNCCDSDSNCVDVGNDNYNIDPNNDNWSTVDSTKTQMNESYDIGEQWFDWGTDKMPDSLETFYRSVLFPNLYENEYIYNFTAGFIQPSPTLIPDTLSLWISDIQKDGNTLIIDVSIHSNVALKGLQFQLSHVPYTRVETILQSHEISIVQNDEAQKLFEDLTLVPRKDYANKLTNIMLVDYANDVSSFLDFDNLDLFLADGENIISHKYSNLVLYIDSVNTNINDSMLVFITYVNSSGEDEPISSELESYAIVYSLSDSIVIPMGAILQKFQSGKIEMYDQLKLKTWDNYYNYSLLSIQHNARLDIMYTK